MPGSYAASGSQMPRGCRRMLFVIRDCYLDLCPARFCRRDQRQKAVRCATGDYLEHTLFLQFAECVDEVAVVPVVPKVERCRQILDVHTRDRDEFPCLILRPHDLFFRKFQSLSRWAVYRPQAVCRPASRTAAAATFIASRGLALASCRFARIKISGR